MTPLPICPAWQLTAAPPQRRWLIDSLWSLEAVGIVGGEPKCCKSFLALDMAVSVASGAPCLRRFPIGKPGPVLLYCAEDDQRQLLLPVGDNYSCRLGPRGKSPSYSGCRDRRAVEWRSSDLRELSLAGGTVRFLASCVR